MVRTDLHCHECVSRGNPANFVAKIDYDLNGNHEIECPRCGHLHYRLVKDGRVTSERYHSDNATHKVARRDMWKSATQPIVTSSATAFMRDLWLNR